jgi:hypothetical protein
MEELLSTYSPGELAFRDHREQATQVHVTCYAIGGTAPNDLAVVQRVETEFQRGQVGVGSFQPDPDASYPCQNQNSWGQLNLEVMDLNGVSAYDQGAQSITIENEPTCLMSGYDNHFFYNGSIHLRQVVSDHLTIDAYMFRNAEAQSAANLAHTMTIGTMDACKMELIYSFRPQTGGGLHAEIDVRQHAFGIAETDVNAAITSVRNTAENKLSIYIPKNKLIEGAGLGPDGCGSTCPTNGQQGGGGTTTTAGPQGSQCSDEAHHLVDVSLSFTCASTGALVNPTLTWEGNRIIIDLTSAQAPESCGTLYWDPLITPVEELGGNTRAIGTSETSGQPAPAKLGVAVGAFVAGATMLA